MGLSFNFKSWLDHKLKNGIYEVRGDEIICGLGRAPGSRLAIKELSSWRFYPEMGMDLVVIELSNGWELRWIDKYNDLIAILRRVAPEKEKTEHTG